MFGFREGFWQVMFPTVTARPTKCNSGRCRLAVDGVVIAVVVPEVRGIRGIGVRIIVVPARGWIVGTVSIVRVGIAVGIRIAVRVGIAVWVRIPVRRRIARVCIISIVAVGTIPLAHIGNVITAAAVPLTPTVIEETTVALRRRRVRTHKRESSNCEQ